MTYQYISTDHPQGVIVDYIGYDWVYFTWRRLILTTGLPQWEHSITCSNKSDSFTITTPDTVYNITGLLPSTYYECGEEVAIWKNKASSFPHPPVSFIPSKLPS